MIVNEKQVFRNAHWAEELTQNGIVKVAFLNEDELHNLRSFYGSMHPNGEPSTMYDGIHMTIWDSDLDYKLKIRDGIKAIIEPAFERNFMNYRAISQQFIVKRKGNDTTFPIHQDWAIVDEEKYFSLNIWIPLQDVDEKNGAMWIVKRSHKIGNKVRGAGVLFPDYIPYIEQLKPHMTSFAMKAGEALIFYHSTIHGSPHNQSNEPRVTIQVTLVPKEAPMHVYFQKSKDTPIELHHPMDDFSFYYDNIREESTWRQPTNVPVGLVNAADSNENVGIESLLNRISH